MTSAGWAKVHHERFPADPGVLFAAPARRKLDTPPRPGTSLRESGRRLAWFPGVLQEIHRRHFVRVLKDTFEEHLIRDEAPIPRHLMTRMRAAHCEVLPHVRRNWTVFFDSSKLIQRVAADSGFKAFCRSNFFHTIAERWSGYSLHPCTFYQVISYESGDYVGPHNDHHPENTRLRNGYVDVQLTVSEQGVTDQTFLWEVDDHLDHQVRVGIASGLSVCCLPFWHQVTPLISVEDARRWVVALTFEKRAGQRVGVGRQYTPRRQR